MSLHSNIYTFARSSAAYLSNGTAAWSREKTLSSAALLPLAAKRGENL